MKSFWMLLGLYEDDPRWVWFVMGSMFGFALHAWVG